MQVCVKTSFGNVIWLDAKASDLIHEVKVNIQYTTGIPIEHQCLRLGSQELEDYHRLWDYGVCPWRGQSGPPIMLYAFRTRMQIRVETCSKIHVCDLEVQTTTKVLDVKTKIQEICCIPPEKQRLLWQGKPLEDAKELKDFDIQMEPWPEVQLLLLQC